MAEDPGPYEPRMEPYPDDYLVPGQAVVVQEGHMLVLTGPLRDLVHRMAPGRPAVTIAGETAELVSWCTSRPTNCARRSAGACRLHTLSVRLAWRGCPVGRPT